MTQGSLRYRTQFADVKGVEVESPLTVRFDFKNNENRTLPLDIATLPVFPEHWWKSRDFAGGGGYEAPLGSGPYKVGKIDSGRSITFERNPDWWGKDLPVSRGLYNFDHFSIEYFGDTDVARQVLRGGAYDYNREFSATGYSIGYDSPALSDGRLQRPTSPPRRRSRPRVLCSTCKAHVPGPSRAPGAGDAVGLRVEQPADDARHVHPPAELFSNTDLAARQLPDAGELAILEPLRGQIPDEVFTQVFEAPKTDGSGVIRDKQLQALDLLEEAGWKPDGDQLVNADGEPLTFTFLVSQNGMDRLLLPYKRTLKQIGIDLNIRRIDSSQYVNRLMSRDYDMIVTGYPVTTSPGANWSITSVRRRPPTLAPTTTWY